MRRNQTSISGARPLCDAGQFINPQHDLASTVWSRSFKHLVRSEHDQARYLVGLQRIFEDLALDTATVYQFVTPDAPHRREPDYDLDRASYGIVKPIWASRDRPTPHWHWEPKEAFRALAREYRRASGFRMTVPSG